VTSVSTHERLGAVTDPDVGLATSFAPPLAWYDPQGQDGEIGDICNGQQGTLPAPQQGTTYTIQKGWSNVSNACLGVTGADAFSLTVTPSNQSLAAGSSVSYQVSTAILRGAAQSVALSVTVPAGVSGSIAPANIAAGGSSTLTISADSSATNGLNTFTVTGTGSVSTASASAHVTINGGSGGGSGCPQGTIDIGGVCIPAAGCNVGAGGWDGGWGWIGMAPLWLASLRRSRRWIIRRARSGNTAT
jgi:hypothetical protein